jgi:hypothetical protein
VNKIWYPEVALADVDAMGNDKSTIIMQVPHPIPNNPCIVPAAKAPAVTFKNY